MLTVDRAGIDTWSPAWYVYRESAAARAMDRLANIRTARGRLLEEPIAGHRVGWIPATCLIWAEGHPGGDRLGRAEELPEVLWRLEQGLWDRGVKVEPAATRKPWRGARAPRVVSPESARTQGFAGIRRVDTTADVRCDTQAEGLAFLSGVYGLGLPRAKTFAYHAPGTGRRPLETVAFHGAAGGRLLARAYDKGIESGCAPRGRLLRVEDQRRYVAATRRPVEEVTTSYLRERYHARFRPLWQASRGVVVAGALVLGQRLGELVDAGEVSARQAESLAGFLLLDQAGVELGAERTRYRRRRQLREHGLVLADGVLQEVEVDLGEVMEQLLDTEPWARQG